MSNLLIEKVDPSLTQVKHSGEGTDKKYYIEGIFLQCDIVNRNNRIYPSSVVDKHMNAYYLKMIESSRAIGELEHPEDTRDNSINLRYTSHKIEKMWKEGSNWYGRAVITKGTPMGATVHGLLSEGIILGTSSRCDGTTVKSGGASVVQDERFHIITASDIVHDPSAPDALVTALMEKRLWVYDGSTLSEQLIDESVKKVERAARLSKLDESVLQSLYTEIMNSVSSQK